MTNYRRAPGPSPGSGWHWTKALQKSAKISNIRDIFPGLIKFLWHFVFATIRLLLIRRSVIRRSGILTTDGLDTSGQGRIDSGGRCCKQDRKIRTIIARLAIDQPKHEKLVLCLELHLSPMELLEFWFLYTSRRLWWLVWTLHSF